MKRSTIVQIEGGLGNQMAQYAMLELLKNRDSSRDYYGDIDVYRKVKIHNGFELFRVFKNISFEEYTPLKRKWEKLIKKDRVRIDQKYVSGYPIQSEVLNPDKNKDYYLHGTWVNYDYAPIMDILTEAFEFPVLCSSDDIKLAEEIKAVESVSVHVRKGDFRDCGRDILGTSFYKKAIDIIRDKVKNPTFFVFSDENIEELFAEFDGDFRFVTGHTGNNSYIDMQLMAMCKHNIVANSTFSYWGGY